MAFNSKILTSIFGRRLGLQRMSSSETGGAGVSEFLVGPDDYRVGVSTAETTSVTLNAHGVSVNLGTSAGSSAVYTLEPPIPGVRKVISGSTANGPVFIKTANAETIISTLGSTHTTVKISTLGGAFELIGLSTSQWLALGLTSGTSSNASGFALTTST